MQRLLYEPAPITLRETGARRVSSRPPEHRGPDYADRFDSETLFFDAIRLNPTTALLLGPPLANLLPDIEQATWAALPAGDLVAPQIRNMDRHCQIRVPLPSVGASISVRSDIGEFRVTPRETRCDLFKGKRVLLTLSKDNDLAWIKDWVRYNRDVHGADAVLIYDNNSTRYTAEDMLDALAPLSGIDAVCVVKWPFKYGPQGIDELAFWDSDFCQHGVLEHARWMFLASARAVMNSDIDELVATHGRGSVFDAAERSLTGLVCYPGLWVYGFSNRQPAVPPAHSYAEFDHYMRPEFSVRQYSTSGYLNTKWTIAPARCPARFQWTTHRIYGLRGWYTKLSMSRRFFYRHYREINTNWHYDRSRRVPFEDHKFVFDADIVRNFSEVRWTV